MHPVTDETRVQLSYRPPEIAVVICGSSGRQEKDLHFADMVELAYTSDLRSDAERIEGSIPSVGTIEKGRERSEGKPPSEEEKSY